MSAGFPRSVDSRLGVRRRLLDVPIVRAVRAESIGEAKTMLDVHTARDRAVRRAIQTGEMPNLDLIHTMQKAEGCQPCFGRTESPCAETICRWHEQCMALSAFSPTALPGLMRHKAPRGAGSYRDGTSPHGVAMAPDTGGTAASSPPPNPATTTCVELGFSDDL